MGKLNSLFIDKEPADCRVVVAMSGGVDSSVVAAMLKAEGYDVIGITMQLYDHGAAVSKPGACCAGQDIHDARRVAEVLDIPHYVLNYEDKFSAKVMDQFADSYIAGETPVPCVLCNQDVKFKDLLETALDLESDVMATGHYVETRPLNDGSGDFSLHQPVDASRDQSYFLFTTSKEELRKLRFPLGGMHKDEVRALAEQYGLNVAHKPDSQDICFVPNGHYGDVIEKLRPGAGQPGNIVDLDGNILGAHKGVIHYTIGQRRGLGIAAGSPLYVVRLDPVRSEVIVGPREALSVSHIRLKNMNWIGPRDIAQFEKDKQLFAKVRSTQPPEPAHMFVKDGHYWVELLKGEEGVAPGQACVLYSSNEGGAQVYGGGWISQTRTLLDLSQEKDNALQTASA